MTLHTGEKNLQREIRPIKMNEGLQHTLEGYEYGQGSEFRPDQTDQHPVHDQRAALANQ